MIPDIESSSPCASFHSRFSERTSNRYAMSHSGAGTVHDEGMESNGMISSTRNCRVILIVFLGVAGAFPFPLSRRLTAGVSSRESLSEISMTSEDVGAARFRFLDIGCVFNVVGGALDVEGVFDTG